MYTPVIGLEIHAELKTESKVFCTCSNEFGGDTNTRCCPTCTGLPGTLPVINRKAVEYAVKAGLSFGCAISPFSKFERKNYFYPDLPKAYQISQLEKPLCLGGGAYIEDASGNEKFIRLNRIHLEEDAGKLIHDDLSGNSLADYNRCGVPLIEIVTEPDMNSAQEAVEFVKAVSLALQYANVCDCKMEQGSLRVDVNISLMPAGSDKLGTRAEIKNLNSTKSVARAIEFEIKRQTKLLDNHERVVQETRGFNDNSGQTKSLRSKEEAQDYRYFIDPDIVPILITEEEIEAIRQTLPSSPKERLETYTKEYGLSRVDAKNIINRFAVSNLFEESLKFCSHPKAVANYILGELFRLMNEQGAELEIPFSAKDLADLVNTDLDGKITKADAKSVLTEMFETGKSPQQIIADNGYEIINDADALKETITEVLANNPTPLQQYKEGKTKVFGFLMGQCNKALKGKAAPAAIKAELERQLLLASKGGDAL